MKKILACAGLLILAACTQQQQATTVAMAGTGLTATDTLALHYVTLPVCPAGATTMPDGTLCSNPSISAQIKSAAQEAFDAYNAYEANPSAALQTAVEQAIAKLAGLIPTTK